LIFLKDIAADGSRQGGSQREASMATIKEEQIRALPGWHLHGEGISRTFHFDDFGAATRFVSRITLDAAVAACQPAIDIRGDRVTVTLATRDATTPTSDDVAVALRIQRLVGDHRHPVGRAGPWSPRGPLTGIRPRPVGQAGP
jgi:pterin-4a-carbinolamine dehydratase